LDGKANLYIRIVIIVIKIYRLNAIVERLMCSSPCLSPCGGEKGWHGFEISWRITHTRFLKEIKAYSAKPASYRSRHNQAPVNLIQKGSSLSSAMVT
jgi:hypothetical protein